jgi:hypothetical protein
MAGLPDADEQYNSASEEDFYPDAAAPADDAAISSDSDDQDATSVSRPKKRKSASAVGDGAEDDLDADFANSGDEGIIKRGKRKRRKGKLDEGDEEGGEGGLIKTRAQRAKE